MSALAADATTVPARREAHEPPEARGLARDGVRMLVADGHRLTHAHARDLPAHLAAGDVLVVNTSATLPAALPAVAADGRELRLHLSTSCDDGRWVVELRDGGERFAGGRAGDRLALPGGASVTLRAPYPSLNPPILAANPGRGSRTSADRRLPKGPALRVRRRSTLERAHDSDSSTITGGFRLSGARLWVAELDTAGAPPLTYLERHGAPIRYRYVGREWPLREYQTVFATHPGSAEMPSAGRPFTHELVTALVARGVAIAPITLHTGVSSQEAGELPYPERFAVPAATARLVNAARAGGGRVVAVGTTVVRALETAAAAGDGRVAPAAGWTRHVVRPATGVRAVDGLLTGWHEPEATHLLMLEAVGGRALVEDSYAAALHGGYRWHEFGDVHLILPARP